MTVASIRSATAADIEPVLALWSAADAVPSVTDDAESVRRAIEDEALIVAERDNEVVGSLIATFDGWRGNMYRLAVHPDHRRHGIATALVDEGERLISAQGGTRITALVVVEHDQAAEFWKSIGYEHDARIARFVASAARDRRRR